MYPLTISPPCFDLTLRLSVSQCTFGKKRRFYRKYIQNKSYKQSLLHELNLYRSAHLIRKYISYSVQKKEEAISRFFFFFVTGNDLSSRAVSSQVLSALKGLTSVFGMRTGCVRDENRWIPFAIITGIVECALAHSQLHSINSFLENYLAFHKSFNLRTSLDLLVSVSSMPCSTYTPDLSPRSLQGVSHIIKYRDILS